MSCASLKRLGLPAALALGSRAARTRRCGSRTHPIARRSDRGSCCSPTRSSSGTAPEVTDCAALVRFAFREALRAHTPEWARRVALPFAPTFPDVRSAPQPASSGWPLFRVVGDARRATPSSPTRGRSSRSTRARSAATSARCSRATCSTSGSPSSAARSPDGVRRPIVLRSASTRDWVVYHTGPTDDGPGEVRRCGSRSVAASRAALAAAAVQSAVRRRLPPQPLMTTSRLLALVLVTLLSARRAAQAQIRDSQSELNPINTGLHAVEQRGLHDARQPVVQPHLPPPHAARFPRLPRARSVRVLRRAARPASAGQRRTAGAAGAQLDRTARRLEGRPAPTHPRLLPRSGELRAIAPSAARRSDRAGDRAARRAQPRPRSRRCRCSIPISSSPRGASCCPTIAIPNTAAFRSTSRSPASTSSRPCRDCCAPTPSSSSRTSASSPRWRPASCWCSPPIASAASRRPGCDVQVLADQKPVGERPDRAPMAFSTVALPEAKSEDIVGVARCGDAGRRHRSGRLVCQRAAARNWSATSTPTSRSIGPGTPFTSRRCCAGASVTRSCRSIGRPPRSASATATTRWCSGSR